MMTKFMELTRTLPLCIANLFIMNICFVIFDIKFHIAALIKLCIREVDLEPHFCEITNRKFRYIMNYLAFSMHTRAAAATT